MRKKKSILDDSISLFRKYRNGEFSPTERIFQIGFNRCGTRTLHQFFLKSGINSVHWEKGEIARKFLKRKELGQDPFKDYNGSIISGNTFVSAFTDMMDFDDGSAIEPYKDYKYIFDFYPDAFYILNVRPVDNWIKSRLSHQQGNFYKNYLFVSSNQDKIVEFWRKEWEEHLHGVDLFFKGKRANYLKFDIENDDPKVLCDFLNKKFNNVSIENYGHIKSKTKARKI